MREILEYYQGRRKLIQAAIREIVDIESPSHNAEASRQVADWVEQQTRASGVDVSIERIAVDDGEHIIVRAFEGEGPGPYSRPHRYVHPVGTGEKNPTRIEDDRLYGCGVFDMKANIVLMFEAFVILLPRQ